MGTFLAVIVPVMSNSVSDIWQSIDLDAYLRSRVAVGNAAGGRGYESGLRVFDCPWCGDTRKRGWMGIDRWGAGCWNTGCLAEPRLPGGAIEWVMWKEGFVTRTRTWAFLLHTFPAPKTPRLSLPMRDIEDWCRLPAGTVSLPLPSRVSVSLRGAPFAAFVRAQWGVSSFSRFELGYCMAGRHAWRVIIPVTMGRQLVAFQSRTIRGAEPKYRTSQHGDRSDPKAECGRPAASLLFNIDALESGGGVLLVEGAGDAMAWEERPERAYPAVALLGTSLTPQKIALLQARRPKRVLLALDAEPQAQMRAAQYLEDLQAWDLPGVLATWEGGKDAGSGGRLRDMPFDRSLRGAVLRRITKGKR